MVQLKRFLRKTGWALLGLLLLSGCEILKGFGEGLGNVFRQFKMP